MAATNPQSCTCTGMRFCAVCIDSPRVKQMREEAELAGTQSAASVFEKNQQHQPQSSCSFASLPSMAPLALCLSCGQTFRKPAITSIEHAESALPSSRGCPGHSGWQLNDELQMSGLFAFPDMITSEQEASLSAFLDGSCHVACPQPLPAAAAAAATNPEESDEVALTVPVSKEAAVAPPVFPGWKDSQSGRRKQDFGPLPNFKKRKVKPSELPGMPLALKELLEVTMQNVNRAAPNDVEGAFVIAQASCLEYESNALANLDPHIDDVWLWGSRVAGVSLLSGCVMTFVHRSGAMVDVHLPRRWGFVLSGPSRYDWLHGIRATGILGRRLSITMRELAPGAGLDDALKSKILSFAQTFV